MEGKTVFRHYEKKAQMPVIWEGNGRTWVNALVSVFHLGISKVQRRRCFLDLCIELNGGWNKRRIGQGKCKGGAEDFKREILW